MIRIFSLLGLLLCSACIQLGGEPQPTRYYLLEPVVTTPLSNATEALRLEIGTVEFPSYLDRAQIVSRTAENTLIIADYDRWAEPLADNLIRTLKENLYQLSPAIQISSAPWNNSHPPELILKLQVNSFDGILGQQTEVDIRWSLYQAQENKEILRRHFVSQLPVENSYKGLVNSLNNTLAELSKQIATALLASP